MTTRGTSSANVRGSSRDRRRRRAWLVERYGIPRRDGKKTRVRCHHCARVMQADGKGWEVDRFPVCGHAGGRYRRDNIVIACIDCNKTRCTTAKKCRVGAVDIVGKPRRAYASAFKFFSEAA